MIVSRRLGIAAVVTMLTAACGLGLVGTDATDVTPDAAGPTCALDASCLGALDPMWTPVSLGAPTCPSGYTTQALVANPRVGAGSCACGACAPSGAYGCPSVPVRGGNTCNDNPLIPNATSGQCAPGSAQHVGIPLPTATGTPTCGAPSDAGTGPVTDTVTLCTPSCAIDFCAATSQCIVADGDQTCPAGFSLSARAGTAATLDCPACTCAPTAPGVCTGTVTVFETNNCDPGSAHATYDAGTCNQYAKNYSGVLVDLVPPAVNCQPGPPPAAPTDAGLANVRTICCH